MTLGKISLFFLLTFSSLLSYGQVSMKNFCSSEQYSIVRLYQNDTLIVKCDTAYLINKSTYELYQTVFKNHRAYSTDVKKLSTLFDQSKVLYENRIRQQDEEYQKLKAQFDDVVSKSNSFAGTTSAALTSLDSSLDKIDSSVSKANENITEVRRDLQAEMRQGFKQRMKWASGGFLLGLLSASVIAIAAN